ncbi:dihydrodipicolinate synthase family protein [Candidatus Aerophobetes bacterium]|nr:dihydrodipicolinate synthase family protein [Candidatus Aerophobetes bacterium]
MKPQDLSGVWIPICTPFTDEKVDAGKLEKNMQVYSQTQLRGYFALGSNGEACMLDREERIKVLRTILKNKGKGQLVMAGCGYESARVTIALAREVADEGADIASVITPHYFKKVMNDDALIKFYERVADESPIPVMLYNAPGFAGGVQLSAKAVARLSEHPNIIGMKDSAPTGPNVFLSIVNRENFAVLAGSANFFITSLLMGAVGGVLSLANFLPQACCRLYDIFQQGDMERASSLQRAILRVNREISGKYGVAGVKTGMDFAGLYGGEPRLPLLPLSQDDREKVRLVLKRFVEEYPEFKSYMRI